MDKQVDVVIADQLIYTRVEADYSPIRKSGFQTVYHSGLTREIVDIIEQRVRCFGAAKADSARLQFFPACDNKVVLAHTISIQTHPEIVDRSYRPGAFLSHCLILNAQDFEKKLQNDPFALFDEFDFINSATQMVERFGKSSFLIQHVAWEYPKQHKNTFSIKPLHAVPLALYLLTADSSETNVLPVLLQVESRKEIELLKLVFQLLPYDRRQDCFFDTQINRCLTRSDWYKIICKNSSNSDTEVEHIKFSDIANKQYNTYEIKSIYTGWLSYINGSDELKQRKLHNLICQAEKIQNVDLNLRRTGVCALDALSKRSIKEIRKVRCKLVEEILDNKISSILNKKLAHLITPYILKAKNSQLIRWSITQSIDDISLHKAIIEFLNDDDTELVDEDWMVIKKFSEKTRNMYLLFHSSTCSKRVDSRSRDKALQLMSQSEYSQLLKKLNNPITPIHFVEESRLPMLLRKNVINLMTNDQIIELIEKFIQIKAEAYITKFVTRIEEFDIESIQSLEKLIRRNKHVAPKVILAITNAKSQIKINTSYRRWWWFNLND